MFKGIKMSKNYKTNAKTMDRLLHKNTAIGTLSYNLYDFDSNEWFDAYFSKPRFKEQIRDDIIYSEQDDESILKPMDYDDQQMMPDDKTMTHSIDVLTPTFKALDVEPSYFVAAFQIDEGVPYFGFAKPYNIQMISGSKIARADLSYINFHKYAKYMAIDQDGIIHPRNFILGNLILRNNKTQRNMPVAQKHYIAGRSRKEFPTMDSVDFTSMVKTYVKDMTTNREMQQAFINMLQTYKTK